ncbi:MAG: AMIN domain-containing protein, partial [Acidobacteria bacterium]|nr:AMIN domain-containing protein [Acidobacteriota bacterium]
MRRRPALAAVLAVCAVAGLVAGVSGAASGAHLTGISARANARSTSVLIEATEPVAYSTTRPDPLTILVNLRGVTVAGAVNHVAGGTQGVVSAVTVQEGTEPDGAPVARVTLTLAQPARHTVRSARNVIEVEIDQQAAAPPQATPVAPATLLRSIIATTTEGAVQVTLAGDGRLTAATIELTQAAPHRLVLDLAGVKSAVPAVLPIGQGPVQRIRVGAFREQPLITRVVFDLTAPAPYHIEAAGEGGRDLRVVFEGPSTP